MSRDQLPTEEWVALKEWAVACQALGRGQQILLVRKGGISEAHREFRVERSEFLLLPTYEHQRTDLLKPFAQPALAALLAETRLTGRVELRYWTKVAEVFQVSEVEQLAAVSDLHLWTDDYATERLRWRPRKPLHLLALRVYQLPQAASQPLLPEYGGCTSWVTLAEPVALAGAEPVLGQAEFDQMLSAVREALGRPALAAEAR
jgi:hypothetical protein